MKSKTTAYLLWLFFGLFGVHKFYLNKLGMGILYIFTAGLFFVGWIVDLFTLGRQVEKYNTNPPESRTDTINTDTEDGNSVFIEYHDINGSFSRRTIEIQKVYEKDGKLYVHAHCYMQGDDRTFLVERIFNMKTKVKGGQKIKDIEGHFRNMMKKPSKVSGTSLAAEALQ